MSAAPSLAPTTPFGQAAEHLQVRLRPDLVVQPQFYEGMTHYVIKDPLALKYFRFKVEEYFLLQQFDGKQQLQDVKKAFERKYRPQTISIEDLTRFVAQLHEASIVQIDSGDNRIWVPGSELPVAKPCETCVPPPRVAAPGEPTIGEQLEERAAKYCAKLSKSIVVTGGILTLGYGMDLTFRCEAPQSGAASGSPTGRT